MDVRRSLDSPADQSCNLNNGVMLEAVRQADALIICGPCCVRISCKKVCHNPVSPVDRFFFWDYNDCTVTD